MVLEAIYEQDFLPCSYGFRPGRSAHQALDALRAAFMGQGVRWCIDVDIKKYFDTIDHGHLRDFLNRRVTDGVIRRMIDKWLKAGVLEEGRLHRPTAGSPQGGVVTPRTQRITSTSSAQSRSIVAHPFLICVAKGNTVMSHAAIDRHAEGSPSERRIRVARSRPQCGGGHHDPVQRLRDLAPPSLPIRPAGAHARRSAAGC